MDVRTWEYLISEGSFGFIVPAVMIAEFFRRLFKGDIVLGREYRRVVTELERVGKEAQQLTTEQREMSAQERRALLERTEAQARRIDELTRMLDDQRRGRNGAAP